MYLRLRKRASHVVIRPIPKVDSQLFDVRGLEGCSVDKQVMT